MSAFADTGAATNQRPAPAHSGPDPLPLPHNWGLAASLQADDRYPGAEPVVQITVGAVGQAGRPETLWPTNATLHLFRLCEGRESVDEFQIDPAYRSATYRDGVRRSAERIMQVRKAQTGDSRSSVTGIYLHVLDTDLTPSGRRWYWVEYRQGEQVAARSGRCSLLVPPLPGALTLEEREGTCRVTWNPIVEPDEPYIAPPRIVVLREKPSHLRFAALPWERFGSVPLGAGEVTFPAGFETTDFNTRGANPLGTTGTLMGCRVHLQAEATAARWNSLRGEEQTVQRMFVRLAELTPAAGSRGEIVPAMRVRSEEGAVPRLSVEWMPWNVERLEVRYARLGTITNEAPSGGAFPLPPGPPEWCELTPDPHRRAAGDLEAARARVPRPPWAPAVMAHSEDGQVRLDWAPLAWDPAHWMEGPRLYVHRRELASPAGSEDARPAGAERVIAVLGPEATAYVDREVVNGRPYAYGLEVRGALRATGWDARAGTVAYAPWWAAREPAKRRGGGLPARAVPGPVRPLRVALDRSGPGDARVNAVIAHLLRRFEQSGWMELTERTAASALFLEQQLEAFGGAGDDGTDRDLAAPTPADIVLSVGLRDAGSGRRIDVRMDDLLNRTRRRMLSLPLEQLDAEAAANRVEAELRDGYPFFAASRREPKQSTCGIIRHVALTSFEPVSPESLPAGALADLLAGAMSHEPCLSLVDRDRIEDVLREQELSGLNDRDQALRLGQLLGADGILCGYYALQGGRLDLQARLIDARSGLVIQVLDLAGRLDALEDLGTRLTGAIASASRIDPSFGGDAVLRSIEAESRRSNEDPATALLVSPENPEHYFAIGEDALKRGEHLKAVAYFRNGLRFEQSETRMTEVLGLLRKAYRELGYRSAELDMWRTFVADREAEPAPGALDTAWCMIAGLLAGDGQRDEALRALARVERPDALAARVYMSLGETTEALRIYTDGLNPSDDRLTDDNGLGRVIDPLAPIAIRLAGPVDLRSYDDLARQLAGGTADAMDRAAILELFVRALHRTYPLQAVRALEELRTLRSVDAELLLMAAGAEVWARNFSAAEGYAREAIGAGLNPAQTTQAQLVLDQLEESAPTLAPGLLRAADQSHYDVRSQRCVVYVLDGLMVRRANRSYDVLWQRWLHPTLDPWTYAQGIAELQRKVASLASSSAFGFLADLPLEEQIEQAPFPLRLRWSSGRINRAYGAGTLLLNDLWIVVDAEHGVVYGIDEADGRMRWRYVSWWPVSRARFLDGNVVLGNAAGQLILLDPADGRVLKESDPRPGYGFAGHALRFHVDQMDDGRAAVRYRADNPQDDRGVPLCSEKGWRPDVQPVNPLANTLAIVDLETFKAAYPFMPDETLASRGDMRNEMARLLALARNPLPPRAKPETGWMGRVTPKEHSMAAQGMRPLDPADQRTKAITALGAYRDHDEVRLLHDSITGDPAASPEEMAAAFRAYLAYPLQERPLDVARATLENPPDPSVIGPAMNTLTTGRDLQGRFAELEWLRQSPHPAVRRNVALRLRELSLPPAAEALADLVSDASPEVREEACRALLATWGIAARPYLAKVLDQPKDPLYTEVVSTLFLVGDRSLQPEVQALPLNIRGTRAGEMGFVALCCTERKDALKLLEQCAGPSARREIRDQVLDALVWRAHPLPRFIPALHGALEHMYLPLALQTAAFLGRTGSEEAIPVLLDLMPGEDLCRGEPNEHEERIIASMSARGPQLIKACAEALEAITGLDLGEDRTAWQAWWYLECSDRNAAPSDGVEVDTEAVMDTASR